MQFFVFLKFSFVFWWSPNVLNSTAGAGKLCPVLHSGCRPPESLPVLGGDHLGELHFSPKCYLVLAGLWHKITEDKSFVSQQSH